MIAGLQCGSCDVFSVTTSALLCSFRNYTHRSSIATLGKSGKNSTNQSSFKISEVFAWHRDRKYNNYAWMLFLCVKIISTILSLKREMLWNTKSIIHLSSFVARYRRSLSRPSLSRRSHDYLDFHELRFKLF